MVSGAADIKAALAPEDKGESKASCPPPLLPADLVIGCIGQPNVGKSSLINALLGARRVHASKTPGKTKHYQTHVLASRPPHASEMDLSDSQVKAGDPSFSRVVLCDSPGLVFPMFSGLEMQVLAGVYNTAHVQAASTCVQFVGQRMPLEEVYRLLGPVEDSDTLRGMRTRKPDPREVEGLTPWTAGLFLEGVAQSRGFRTAKAARLDTNRAANWVLRALAEGRIHWAFRPPTERLGPPDTSDGIWLRELDAATDDLDIGNEEDHNVHNEGYAEPRSEQSSDVDQATPLPASAACGLTDIEGTKRLASDKTSKAESKPEPDSEFLSESESGTDDAVPGAAAASRFAALQIDDDDASD